MSGKQIGRPRAKEELEKHTYALPRDLVKAMKRKAVEEDKTVVEVMRDVLRAGIEPKYFNEY
ncbi:hypothetical protein ACJDU8_00970 [Clostridium sp. WILCCON 0269]|uniref:CopG family transcriptional regulator n=1 Tax=Candidatus Clostridium eludens TaxID=3381663 RepID=A0ABW8SG09_9CLOT